MGQAPADRAAPGTSLDTGTIFFDGVGAKTFDAGTVKAGKAVRVEREAQKNLVGVSAPAASVGIDEGLCAGGRAGFQLRSDNLGPPGHGASTERPGGPSDADARV